MITLSFFNSVEFYVIAVVTAAAIVGLCVRPEMKGEAKTFLISGDISDDGTQKMPSIYIICNDDGTVDFIRYGIDAANGIPIANYFITVIGFDITVEERISYTHDIFAEHSAMRMKSSFIIDFLGTERYHLTFRNDSSENIAALYFRNTPGVHISKMLS